ncbi:MAG: peptidylprolyl isomerase [Flavobacteriales bacterium]|nr:peptidylprolyl isomerase [Flavobacteriales bacterium]
MQITPNKVVSLKYKLSNHQTGEKIEETNEQNPLVFLYGVGGLIPEFEENLAGKQVGDSFDFHITASNAYGDHDPEHIAMIPSNVFHDDNGNFDNEMFKVGAMIPMSDSEGNHMQGKIVEVDSENVKMDFNHPLAGTDLHFEGQILEIREATEDELAHGHVHGEHGHQH